MKSRSFCNILNLWLPSLEVMCFKIKLSEIKSDRERQIPQALIICEILKTKQTKQKQIHRYREQIEWLPEGKGWGGGR